MEILIIILSIIGGALMGTLATALVLQGRHNKVAAQVEVLQSQLKSETEMAARLKQSEDEAHAAALEAKDRMHQEAINALQQRFDDAMDAMRSCTERGGIGMLIVLKKSAVTR